MKKMILLFGLLCVIGSCKNEKKSTYSEKRKALDNLPNLIVEENQTKRIAPTRHPIFDTIYIKKNAILKVNDNGSKWLILKANVLICDGTIEYTNFKRGLGNVVGTFHDNVTTVEHEFNETYKGGAGGAGSGNGYQAGGVGFKPRDYNGGGGGSGAYYVGTPRFNQPGISAIGQGGAPSPSDQTRCYGGDGGIQTSGHGGLIALDVNVITFGSSSQIILRGNKGVEGSAGGAGDCYGGGQVYYWGGGGGGGGAAGGNGGVLLVRSKKIYGEPFVDTNPGAGGDGGKEGRSLRCGHHGQRGSQGSTGELGYVDWNF